MKKRHLFLAAGLCLRAACCQAQSTVVATVPAGYLTQTLAAATSSGPNNGTLSVPLYPAAVYAGAITSVDSATAFTSASATWTSGQFTSAPCFARIKSGANVGRCFPITANSATQLTVNPQGATDAQPYDLTALLKAGDTFEVFPANTLGSLFGVTGGPFLTGSTASVADNVCLWDVVKQTWAVYFNNGSHWRSASSLQNQDNVLLYPEEGFYIVRRSTAAPLTVSFLGTAPSTTERTDLPGQGTVCVANRFPVDATLGGMALQNLPGWQTGTTASLADEVCIWNAAKNAWDVCFYNGSHWRSAASLQNIETTETLPAGTAMLVVRKNGSNAANATFAQTLPYSTDGTSSTNAVRSGDTPRPGARNPVTSAVPSREF